MWYGILGHTLAGLCPRKEADAYFTSAVPSLMCVWAVYAVGVFEGTWIGTNADCTARGSLLVLLPSFIRFQATPVSCDFLQYAFTLNARIRDDKACFSPRTRYHLPALAFCRWFGGLGLNPGIDSVCESVFPATGTGPFLDTLVASDIMRPICIERPLLYIAYKHGMVFVYVLYILMVIWYVGCKFHSRSDFFIFFTRFFPLDSFTDAP